MSLVSIFPDGATEADFRDLANEAEIMSNVGQHPNLINLIGVCSAGGDNSRQPLLLFSHNAACHDDTVGRIVKLVGCDFKVKY